ncbi:MAG: hypothetical protein FIB08_05670 [Candidatus Methanoperedens sp.]|nr:hypothetical protein [Candidatus Methanoperedens sp.]
MVEYIEKEAEMKDDNEDPKQKGLENLILLVLGIVDRKISFLHLEKEVFLLWNFHPKIKPFLNFIKHYRGPYSKEIQEAIQDPVYFENHWIYSPPPKGDKLSGGYVELTDAGRNEYERLSEIIKNNDELLHLFTGIKIVRELYDKLTLKELLLLIYNTYPEYIERSNVYKDIFKDKKALADGLIKKGLIDTERYESLLGGN